VTTPNRTRRRPRGNFDQNSELAWATGAACLEVFAPLFKAARLGSEIIRNIVQTQECIVKGPMHVLFKHRSLTDTKMVVCSRHASCLTVFFILFTDRSTIVATANR
jgi:hypothetical protein